MVVLQNGILYELSSDVSEEICGDIQDIQMVYLEYVLFHDLPIYKTNKYILFVINKNKVSIILYL